MENVESHKNPTEEISSAEKPSTTEELVAEIEADRELAEFTNGVKMAEDYITIGAMEFLGDMTEEAMKKIADKEAIRAELIPEQLRNESEAEYKVYKTTKKFNSGSAKEQNIIQDESERNKILEKDAATQYESVVNEGRSRPLDLSREEIIKYKKDNNIPNENIKSATRLDEDGNLVGGVSRYYEITD